MSENEPGFVREENLSLRAKYNVTVMFYVEHIFEAIW